MSYSLVQLQSATDLSVWTDSGIYKAFSVEQIQQQQVDRHLLVLDATQKPCARCSLWWQQVPAYNDHKLGVIGHFAALDAQAAQFLLTQACLILKQQGATLAVGPMDGNTWRRYRFVVEPGTEAPFFLEPENPREYPDYFRAQGFEVLAYYTSALNDDLTKGDERVPKALQRLADSGVTLRSLNMQAFQAELESIYTLSLTSFANNFLYTPIAKNEFLQQYQKIQAYVKPELTLMAHAGDELIGFAFAIPDLLRVQRLQLLDTLIIKTVAVLPGRRSAGLGAVLVSEVQRIAHEHGYKRAIHALMHESNQSRNISNHTAHIMRRYALFAKPL